MQVMIRSNIVATGCGVFLGAAPGFVRLACTETARCYFPQSDPSVSERLLHESRRLTPHSRHFGAQAAQPAAHLPPPRLQGYYDNRYWTMWKLPMFGCNDPNQVLQEVDACKRAFTNSYIRLVAFDNIAQCQTISFLVHRPADARDFRSPERRSVS